jgi:hypothetical protein
MAYREGLFAWRVRFSKTFLVWNLLGIADFVNAVFLGTLYLWPGFASSINTALMQRLPFALIPCFFAPLGLWRVSLSWNSGEKDRVGAKQDR